MLHKISRLSIDIHTALKDYFREACELNYTTMSTVVKKAIHEYCKKHLGKKRFPY